MESKDGASTRGDKSAAGAGPVGTFVRYVRTMNFAASTPFLLQSAVRQGTGIERQPREHSTSNRGKALDRQQARRFPRAVSGIRICSSREAQRGWHANAVFLASRGNGGMLNATTGQKKCIPHATCWVGRQW